MSTVSVIIPVKNRAALLRKTLDNLLAQSHKPEEIIVVDDHSTDDFKLVIFDYITDCIFLNNKGEGPGAARNLGLSVATGKYIQFFDSDDLLTQGKIEAQVQALENSGADMAYGPYVQAEETAEGWKQRDVVMQWKAMPSTYPLTDWMLRGWNAITQSCLFRRSLLDRCPLWDTRLITHEDYLYLYELSLQEPKLIHVPEEAVLYRQHGLQSTLSQTQTESRALDKIEVLTRIREMVPSSKAEFVSKGLFFGRMAQNQKYLRRLGVDTRRYQGYMGIADPVWEWVYRLYNKQQRNKTKTLWEPMHGVSADPDVFTSILKKLPHV
jgi:glycosyltransferase involved in cell wall biosynthesis